MGYTTEFAGQFEITPTLTLEDKNHLEYMAKVRHESETYPGLYCQWRPTKDGRALKWDGGEKFYDYVEWLQYLITEYLAPRGYVLTGEVRWQGEEIGDVGLIIVAANNVVVRKLEVSDRSAAEYKAAIAKFIAVFDDNPARDTEIAVIEAVNELRKVIA